MNGMLFSIVAVEKEIPDNSAADDENKNFVGALFAGCFRVLRPRWVHGHLETDGG
jgi:hypothetical protein